MKSSTLKLFFQAERETCNQMVASIRHQSQHLDINDLNWFMSNCLDPLMVKLDGQSNLVTFPVAHAGFRHGLELASINWLKSDYKKQIVIKTWNEFYPNIIHIVQQAPNKVFSETSNVFSHLHSFGNEQPVKWLALMSKVLNQLDTHESLKEVGFVCAWMAGLAHFRELSVKQLETLSPPLVRALFDLSDGHDIKFHLDKLKNNRWSKALPLLAQVNPPLYTVELRIGSCDLFGGEFPTPPKAFVVDEHLFIESGKFAWQLYADVFGSTLIPFDIDELKGISEEPSQSPTLSSFNSVLGLSDINEASSIASLTDTVALTSNETFAVIILSTSSPGQLEAGR